MVIALADSTPVYVAVDNDATEILGEYEVTIELGDSLMELL